MKNWSIQVKLGALCGSLLALVVLVAGVDMRGERILIQRLDYTKNVQLPSVRAMSLADMIHDGLRAVVYRAILVGQENSEAEKAEVLEELKEMSATLNEQMDILKHLPLSDAARKMVVEAEPDIRAYLQQAETIIPLALSGQTALVKEKTPLFQTAFSSLEESLGKIGDSMTNEAAAENIAAEKSEALQLLIQLFVKISGVLLGIIISILTVRSLVKTLSQTIDALSQSNSELNLAAEQSSSSAATLSGSTAQQASGLQQTMASIEEISAMVAQNAESANKAKLKVDENQTASEEGSHSVGNMMTAIGEIKSTNESILAQMEETTKEFAEIVKIISGIGEKTKVINDIVFQTKLLSFNASVEAARAGENGKGFAVVAEEVGNLAQMSGTAAKEISDMLSASITQVNGIVERSTRRVDELVTVGKEKIEVGQVTSEKCQESLTKIAHNATALAGMITEIANASKEQAQGVQEINKAIIQLDTSTQKSSTIAHSSSHQAEQLRNEAHALSKVIETLIGMVRGRQAAMTLATSSTSAPVSVNASSDKGSFKEAA